MGGGECRGRVMRAMTKLRRPGRSGEGQGGVGRARERW